MSPPAWRVGGDALVGAGAAGCGAALAAGDLFGWSFGGVAGLGAGELLT